MGIFDKLSKKHCDVCGDKIGMLGNKKLEDGNLCKGCAKKLSPFFSDRKRSTVDDIKAQLAYREENKSAVAAFNASRTLGKGTKVIIDENAHKFIVSPSSRWKEENPDVIDLSQVTGSNLNIDETQEEKMRKDKDGNKVSYSPRRYVHKYDFWMTIHVNHPYFNEIRFLLNNMSVKVEPPVGGLWIQGGSDVGGRSPDYRQYEAMAEEIQQALTRVRENVHEDVREDVVASNTPKMLQTCPLCGASTTPDLQGKCEFCGGAIL